MAQAAQFRARPMTDVVTIVRLIRVAGSGWCSSVASLPAAKAIVGARMAGESGSITVAGLILRLAGWLEWWSGSMTATGIGTATATRAAGKTRLSPAPPMTCIATTARPTPGRQVQLLKQRSDSACRQGYSWGYDRRGIWVDHGCRADFQIVR